jgi:5-methylcytosine-specific restriction endonuclease McrA
MGECIHVPQIQTLGNGERYRLTCVSVKEKLIAGIGPASSSGSGSMASNRTHGILQSREWQRQSLRRLGVEESANGRVGAKQSPRTATDGQQSNPTNQKPSAERIYLLLIRQGKRCALTGDAMTPESVAIDHIVSLADGGSHDMSNLQIINHDVNRAKGTMSNAEFIAMCERVADHARRTKIRLMDA